MSVLILLLREHADTEGEVLHQTIHTALKKAWQVLILCPNRGYTRTLERQDLMNTHVISGRPVLAPEQ